MSNLIKKSLYTSPKIFYGVAHVFAAAIRSLYPDVFTEKIAVDEGNFELWVYFPYPEHAELKELIEQKIRQIIKEDRPIDYKHMLYANGQKYINHKMHIKQAPLDYQPKELVTVIELGNDYAALCEEEILKNTSEIAFFTILDLDWQKNQLYIRATANDDKAVIKSREKKFKNYSKINWKILAKKHQLFFEIDDELVWLEQGLKIEKLLIELLNTYFSSEKIEKISSPGITRKEKSFFHEKYLSQAKKKKVAEIAYVQNEENFLEGVFKEKYCNTVLYTTIGTFEQGLKSCISSLNFLREMFNIVGFSIWVEVDSVLNKKNFAEEKKLIRQAVEANNLKLVFQQGDMPAIARIYVQDELERKWLLGCILVNKHIREWKIQTTMITSTKKWIAMIIEHNNDKLDEILRRLTQMRNKFESQ